MGNIMMNKMLLERIINIVQSFCEEKEISFSDINEDLSQYGIDSMSFIQLVMFLEEEFDLEFPDEKLIFSEMNTVNKFYEIICESESGEMNNE